MSLMKIKKEIASNLTGNQNKDREYLLQAAEKYKDDPSAKQILMYIGQEIFKATNNKTKEEAYKIVEKEDVGTQAVLSEVEYYLERQDYKKAYGLINVCIGLIERNKEYQDSDTCEYHCFKEIAEEIIYRYVSQSNKEFVQIDQDYSKAYYLFGISLKNQYEVDKAIKAFETALKYNPMNMEARFELLELNRAEFVNIFNEMSKLVYKKDDIVRLLKDAIDYYAENEDEVNKEKYDKYLELFSTKRVVNKDDKDELKIAPNPDILGILYNFGKKYQAEKKNKIAVYYFNYLYELTFDSEIKDIISSLK